MGEGSTSGTSASLVHQARWIVHPFPFIVHRSSFTIRATLWLGLLLVVTARAHAERLPIKVYTTADGLAQNAVNRIVRDSRGFLWFCTEDGLSRYDGYTFTNYGIEQGLPNARVRDLLETREGEYWVATGDGLCRFNPKGRPESGVRSLGSGVQNNKEQTPDTGHRTPDDLMFTVFYPGADMRTRSVMTLLQDRSGVIWCGTAKGLFRLDRSGDQIRLTPIDIGLPFQFPDGGWIYALCEDRHGTLWVGAASGLFRRWPDGHAECYNPGGPPMGVYHSLLEDRQGNLWVGTRGYGLLRLVADSGYGPSVVAGVYTPKNGLPSHWIWDTCKTSDGRLWIATNLGLCEFLPSGDARGYLFRAYPRIRGIGSYEILSLAEDKDGNLWMGTNATGVMKLARSGFMAFGETDGMLGIESIFENTNGELCLVGFIPGNRTGSVAEGIRIDETDPASFQAWRRLGRFDGQRFTWLRPNAPKRITEFFGQGWNQIALQDHTGEWWIIAYNVHTSEGELYRFPKISRFEHLKTISPKAVYTTKDGLPTADPYRLFEDSRGDIWISCIWPIESGLARWERATDKVYDMTRSEGLPSFRDHVPTSFREDRAGNLWIGFSRGVLARYRDGRFTTFTSDDGIPAGSIYDLHLDQAGRLRIASTTGGLARLDDPSAERPRFITTTTAQGLSSNIINCITEDRYGHLYVGTARGLDRLDPATGRITQFTSADGLITGEVWVSFRDRKGDLWFGGKGGLSRLSPQPDPPTSPTPILINGVRIAGSQHVISALGETTVSLPDLTADKNQLQIDFVGLSFAPGESLCYQYQLAGADREWSAPTDQRTVNYANLAPGRYRFLVRAINSDGVVSPTPATITFTILRPVWQRWWLIMLMAMLVGLVVWAFYRYRLAQALKLERVRTRIATDLHDDIGSSLSQVAILSEVVKQHPTVTQPKLVQMLTQIAEMARNLVDGMSDIVWSIDPRRDDLNNLSQRIGQFAFDVLDVKGISWELQSPPVAEPVKLTPEQRRHIYLIFKEAVNNIVRHANATAVLLTLNVSGRQLLAEISDNGRGFESGRLPTGSDRNRGGHGLRNMRARADQLGGQLRIDSAPGNGTRLTLMVPL
ncbi:MAG: ATP-binding protein [Acidobacteria bacterium]|nr:ATP-binding protein [Acidobacteriota bacterium]